MKNALMLVMACSLSAGLARAQEIEWRPVSVGPLREGLRVPGRVIPKEGALSIESARVQGRVTEILKREGDAVSEGDGLFAVNSAECISLLEEKRVAASQGIQELIEGTKRREQQLGLRVRSDHCEIRAAHSGTITKRQVELGASFNIGDPLETILDVRNLGIELDVPERDLSSVRLGQKVHVELASDPGHPITTAVEHILPTIDPVTRSSKVRLAPVHLPTGTTLDALAFGEINVENHQSIFEVPTTAIVFSHNQQYVVKKSSPTAVAVPVEVVNETDRSSAIRPSRAGGLAPHDEVAVKGAIYLLGPLIGR